MSQRTVGIVINRLLGDESLRLRFEEDPVETVGELLAHGVELTPNEIDLFVQSDAQMWFWIDQRAIGFIDVIDDVHPPFPDPAVGAHRHKSRRSWSQRAGQPSRSNSVSAPISGSVLALMCEVAFDHVPIYDSLVFRVSKCSVP
jgi:hypothetical protein